LAGLGESDLSGVGSAAGAPGPCYGAAGADLGNQGTGLGICDVTPEKRARVTSGRASLCAEQQPSTSPVVDGMKGGDPPGGRVGTGTPDPYGVNDGRTDPGGAPGPYYVAAGADLGERRPQWRHGPA
jgi:hypothetical protein